MLRDFWTKKGFGLSRLLLRLTAICGWQSGKLLELRTDIQFQLKDVLIPYMQAGLILHCSTWWKPCICSPCLWQYSMHAGSVRWTLKWAHRSTSNKISHTLPVCQEEKGRNKRASPHPDRVHSDPPSVSPPILPSASLFPLYISAKQLSASTVWAVLQVVAVLRVLLWPRMGDC